VQPSNLKKKWEKIKRRIEGENLVFLMVLGPNLDAFEFSDARNSILNFSNLERSNRMRYNHPAKISRRGIDGFYRYLVIKKKVGEN